MKLNRTVGIEMEGYIFEFPPRVIIPHADIGTDQSLRNYIWSHNSGGYGVEIRTNPLNDTDMIALAFAKMQKIGWYVDECAGTHIHVDISDFTECQKALLLRLGKGIERIIFMFVESYRYHSEYCIPIARDWRKIFWSNGKFSQMDWDRAEYLGLPDYFQQTNPPFEIWNSKYQWMNIFESKYPTCEFRLFHAAKSASEVTNQALLAYNIVEMVKNSTIEQVEFMVKTLYSFSTVEETIEAFFQMLVLEEMPILCGEAYDYLDAKYRKRNIRQSYLRKELIAT